MVDAIKVGDSLLESNIFDNLSLPDVNDINFAVNSAAQKYKPIPRILDVSGKHDFTIDQLFDFSVETVDFLELTVYPHPEETILREKLYCQIMILNGDVLSEPSLY